MSFTSSLFCMYLHVFEFSIIMELCTRCWWFIRFGFPMLLSCWPWRLDSPLELLHSGTKDMANAVVWKNIIVVADLSHCVAYHSSDVPCFVVYLKIKLLYPVTFESLYNLSLMQTIFWKCKHWNQGNLIGLAHNNCDSQIWNFSTLSKWGFMMVI